MVLENTHIPISQMILYHRYPACKMIRAHQELWTHTRRPDGRTAELNKPSTHDTKQGLFKAMWSKSTASQAKVRKHFDGQWAAVLLEWWELWAWRSPLPPYRRAALQGPGPCFTTLTLHMIFNNKTAYSLVIVKVTQMVLCDQHHFRESCLSLFLLPLALQVPRPSHEKGE